MYSQAYTAFDTNSELFAQSLFRIFAGTKQIVAITKIVLWQESISNLREKVQVELHRATGGTWTGSAFEIPTQEGFESGSVEIETFATSLITPTSSIYRSVWDVESPWVWKAFDRSEIITCTDDSTTSIILNLSTGLSEAMIIGIGVYYSAQNSL